MYDVLAGRHARRGPLRVRRRRDRPIRCRARPRRRAGAHHRLERRHQAARRMTDDDLPVVVDSWMHGSRFATTMTRSPCSDSWSTWRSRAAVQGPVVALVDSSGVRWYLAWNLGRTTRACARERADCAMEFRATPNAVADADATRDTSSDPASTAASRRDALTIRVFYRRVGHTPTSSTPHGRVAHIRAIGLDVHAGSSKLCRSQCPSSPRRSCR